MRRLGQGWRKPPHAQEPVVRPPQMPVPVGLVTHHSCCRPGQAPAREPRASVRMSQGSLAPGTHSRHSRLLALAYQVRPGKCWKRSFPKQAKQEGSPWEQSGTPTGDISCVRPWGCHCGLPIVRTLAPPGTERPCQVSRSPCCPLPPASVPLHWQVPWGRVPH